VGVQGSKGQGILKLIVNHDVIGAPVYSRYSVLGLFTYFFLVLGQVQLFGTERARAEDSKIFYRSSRYHVVNKKEVSIKLFLPLESFTSIFLSASFRNISVLFI